MSKREDLIGHKFGELTVIAFAGIDKRRCSKWLCKCSCNKELIVVSDSLKRGATKSCGSCVYYSKTVDLTGRRFGKLTVVRFSHIDKKQRASMWEVICACGKTTVVRGNALTSKHVSSCGCLIAETASKVHKGEKNANWKGGITPVNKAARTSSLYLAWRKSVFQRDNYTCQKCLQRGGKLHAHHIRSFASNPKLRTDLDNGICLCEHCHLSFHQRYGKLDNNKRQLNSFLKLKT